MKTPLLALVLCGLSLGTLLAADPSFIVVTTETTWSGGLVSSAGDVEQIVSENADGFVISTFGRNYVVPKANARRISTAEAAVALIAQRQQLYVEIQTLEARPAAGASGPTQYNGRPLPRNWIDPKQADANFHAQQLQNSIDANTRALEAQQLEMQRRRLNR